MDLTKPTYDDVVRAQDRLKHHLPVTPLVRGEQSGAWLKLENLQQTGAYKVRGALNALLAQLERGDHRPVVAASAGNHSAGVAWAASKVGLRSIAVVPNTAPHVKIESTRKLGAQVIVHGENFDAAQAYAMELAERHGARFLPAFDDPDVIAGQGTIGLELLWAAPEVVAVPIGGGGLVSGIGIVLKAHGIHVVGVQPVGVDAMRQVLLGCDPADPVETIADGVRVKHPGRLTREICKDVVDEIVTLEESEVRSSMLQLAQNHQILVEGAGALAPAVLERFDGSRVVGIVSGGNVDLSTLMHQLHAARCTLAPKAVDLLRKARPNPKAQCAVQQLGQEAWVA